MHWEPARADHSIDRVVATINFPNPIDANSFDEDVVATRKAAAAHNLTDRLDVVEPITSNRFKNALRTDEIVNAPDWVSDLAACLALAVTMVEKQDRPGLQAFAHRELDRFIAERIAEEERDEPE
jgi:hypothetical protein